MIGAGSLRMDKGEDVNYALAAVDRMSRHPVTHYAFDVIYKDMSQREAAYKALDAVRASVLKKMPNVEFYSGVTMDEMVRPGGFEMLSTLHDKGELGPVQFIDINPEREENWK